MADKYREQEHQIQLALRYISTKTSYKLSDVARMYGVDYHRLRRRLHGSESRSSRPPTNQKLTDAQIMAIELYIKRLDLIGQPPLLP